MEGLKDIYKDYFKIGAAVNPFTAKTYADLVKTHFNSITCENEMKFGNLYDGKEYTFDKADVLARFAEDNGMDVHGHTLVWHNQTPDAIFEKDADYLIETFKKHVAIIKDRYGKNMRTIDVVNEAIEDKSDAYLRDTKWKEKLGDNYIHTVFKLTKEIMPDVKLFYNDYNECTPDKREKILRLVDELRADGAPIDGIGMQSHYNIYSPTLDEVKRSMEAYAKTGLLLHISELDVSVFAFEDKTKLEAPTDELVKKQAEYYKGLFKIYREYHEHIDRVTFWGVTDTSSWLNYFPVFDRKNWPLLFDWDGSPKEAYYAVAEF